jgi:RNA polymerase sigma factor (sigma-70 family)
MAGKLMPWPGHGLRRYRDGFRALTGRPSSSRQAIIRAASVMSRADAPEAAKGLFLEQLTLIESVTHAICGRNRLSAFDADDFSSHVKLKLIQDDYSILRQFQARSSWRTYLTIVVQRLFLDYRDHEWGKWRPSAVARRAGAVGMLLERLTTRDGHTLEEACQLLATHHQVQTSREDLDRLFAQFPSRSRQRPEPEERASHVPASTPAPDEAVAAAERRETMRRVREVLERSLSRLPPEDRLALTLRFQDGRTIGEVSRILGDNPKRFYRRFENLLQGLRADFEGPLFEEQIDSSAESDHKAVVVKGTKR